MQLPFAVYTARQGYGWASGLEHGQTALECYRKALGKFPEADYGDAMTCGAVNAGDMVVAYRFLTAKYWDSKGRNALYLALTFFPRAVAGEIDLERLLGMAVFTKPLREPPAWLEYGGGGSTDSPYDPASDTGAGQHAVDLSCAGRVFQKSFEGTLKIWRAESGSRCSCVYARPVAVTPRPDAKAEQRVLHDAEDARAPSGSSASVMVKASWWKRHRAATAAVAGCLVAGYFIWMKADLIWREKGSARKPVASGAESMASWGDWPVGPDGHWRGLWDMPVYGECCAGTREADKSRINVFGGDGL